MDKKSRPMCENSILLLSRAELESPCSFFVIVSLIAWKALNKERKNLSKTLSPYGEYFFEVTHLFMLFKLFERSRLDSRALFLSQRWQ